MMTSNTSKQNSKHYNEFVKEYSKEIDLIFSCDSDVLELYHDIILKELSNQQFGTRSLQAHIRQSLKDQRLGQHLLNDPIVVTKKMIGPIENLTIRLLDKRYENLVGLKRAFSEANEKVDLTITDKLRPINARLKQQTLETFHRLDKLKSTSVVVPASKSRYKEAEIEYMQVLLKALKNSTHKIDINAYTPTYYCAEDLSDRLMVLSMDIAEKGLATMADLESSFARAYKQANDGRNQRIQTLTYDTMMANFNRLVEKG